MDEIKNEKLNGGLQLLCLASMRVIDSGDRKTIEHIYLWLGDVLDALALARVSCQVW